MALPASDNFDRANGGLGSNWTTITGQAAPQIATNSVKTNATGSDSAARWNVDSFAANQWSQIDIIQCKNGSDRLVGALLRGASGANTFYACSCIGNLGTGTATVEIRKEVAGVNTTIATAGSKTINVGDVLRGEVSGTVLLLKVNNVPLLGPSTDSAIASGSAGIFIFVDTNDDNDAKLDNWIASNLGNSLFVPNRSQRCMLAMRGRK